jgi:hypothetical protein
MYLCGLARGADKAIRPAKFLNVGAALGFIAKLFEHSHEVHIEAPMLKKPKKHPKDMNTEEAMQHLFTKRGHKIIKRHLADIERVPSTKKG